MRHSQQIAKKLKEDHDAKLALEESIVHGKSYGPKNEEFGHISIRALETGTGSRETEPPKQRSPDDESLDQA